jgi:hypothetical protein
MKACWMAQGRARSRKRSPMEGSARRHGLSLRDALRFSMDVFLNELYQLEDSREGLRALIEKRKPEWKNR